MAAEDLEKMTATEPKEEGKEKPEEKKSTAKGQIDKKALKQQLRVLKSEKDKLLHSHDKKGLAKLRKKIKRYKRLTKKKAA